MCWAITLTNEGQETLDNYLASSQPEITDEGEILDNVYLKQEVKIKTASLGYNSGIIGAASLLLK